MNPALLSGLAIGLLVGAIVAGAIVFLTQRPKTDAAYANLESEITQRRQATENEAQERQAQGQKEIRELRAEADQSVERRYQDISRREERQDQRQSSQDTAMQKLEAREQSLAQRKTNLDERERSLDNLEGERQVKLEEVAGLTRDEAKQQLLTTVELEARQDMARVMREIEEEARETGETKARKLIAMAIQRVASDHVSETTVSVVNIPNDEMKGRIIGRNGRNIRAFEQAAGVDVVVDDTPEAVTVSSFDPVRREVAKRALTKLITDGRIHPARIEKSVLDAQKEVEKVIKEAGETAAYEANVHGLHPEVLKMLGRLNFRTSYGQNQLHHAVEASKIAAILAAEMGADINIAKMGGLLHDLGKAMDHDQEGTHALLGADFARRFKVPAIVVNAIAAHHHEVEPESVEAIITEAADAISGARPGARRESLENYVKRVRTLEDIATSFDGVESAYALQAGREIRVLVKPGAIDDLGSMRLSKDIARTIEESMQYPGQIQVTVIRETRAVGYAK